jgi:hypothetical protein
MSLDTKQSGVTERSGGNAVFPDDTNSAAEPKLGRILVYTILVLLLLVLLQCLLRWARRSCGKNSALYFITLLFNLLFLIFLLSCTVYTLVGWDPICVDSLGSSDSLFSA